MDKAPYAAQLDRLVEIIRKVPTQGGTGGVSYTDETVCSPWAMLSDDAGSQSNNGKTKHEVTRQYVVYAGQGINKDHVLVDEGLRFTVEHISPVGRSHVKLTVKLYE